MVQNSLVGYSMLAYVRCGVEDEIRLRLIKDRMKGDRGRKT
jgi:hypothetical protein